MAPKPSPREVLRFTHAGYRHTNPEEPRVSGRVHGIDAVLGQEVRAGQKLEWDAEQMVATNCPEASQFLAREPRKGWSL